MGKEIFGYVYMVRNKVNGKLYFGITENDFDTRYKGNIHKYTHNEHLKNSIKKYGIENFEINEQFDVAYTEDDLWDLEDMYMCIYNTLDSRYGYNKKRSGSKSKGCGRQNQETRYKMSESHKGKHFSADHKQKMSDNHADVSGEKNPMYGKKRSEESKQKIRGNKNPKAKTVICLNTLQVFTTVKEANEWCGIKCSSDIAKCCKGKNKTCGKHPQTGERLKWMFYEDYLKLNENSDSNVA